jgi:chromosome segregation ATPase
MTAQVEELIERLLGWQGSLPDDLRLDLKQAAAALAKTEQERADLWREKRELKAALDTEKAVRASLQDRVARLEDLLEPFANMADANMHDPLEKWLRVGHIQDAAAVLQTKAQEISE